MIVEVYRRDERESLWDWRIRADNGQIVATSGGQGYSERNDAVEAYFEVEANLQAGEMEMRYL